MSIHPGPRRHTSQLTNGVKLTGIFASCGNESLRVLWVGGMLAGVGLNVAMIGEIVDGWWVVIICNFRGCILARLRQQVLRLFPWLPVTCSFRKCRYSRRWVLWCKPVQSIKGPANVKPSRSSIQTSADRGFRHHLPILFGRAANPLIWTKYTYSH